MNKKIFILEIILLCIFLGLVFRWINIKAANNMCSVDNCRNKTSHLYFANGLF